MKGWGVRFHVVEDSQRVRCRRKPFASLRKFWHLTLNKLHYKTRSNWFFLMVTLGFPSYSISLKVYSTSASGKEYLPLVSANRRKNVVRVLALKFHGDRKIVEGGRVSEMR
ncbi:hypothetical protein L1987_48567 [Smallanthus sonchifolius]|uniref:Uncharacterized protein n=1 Tax=Smallanthus sonchifolius TaxID=185202 RepID=A0ACB9FT73_9ASTR|nr:hypothetical protein L1987_48567 [Smallanthus sonchifolius]